MGTPKEADYAAIEARILGHMIQDGDIHAETAQELFGEVTQDTRSRAKTINYNALYGVKK